eukprot:14378291-Alexandrium_andersonii.AAC.1
MAGPTHAPAPGLIGRLRGPTGALQQCPPGPAWRPWQQTARRSEPLRSGGEQAQRGAPTRNTARGGRAPTGEDAP